MRVERKSKNRSTGDHAEFRQLKLETLESRQKSAEEELRFRSVLLDSATDSVFVRDFEGKLIYVNEAAYKTRGYTKEELLALPLQKLRSPKHAEDVDSLVKTLMKTKGAAVYETEHLRKDGTLMPVEVNARIIKSGGRKVIVSIVRDITERERAEKALRQSEEKYRTLYLTMAQGVLYRDADGTITSANPAAERIFGMTLDEMKSKPLDDPIWSAIDEEGSDMRGDMYPSMVALRTGKVVRNTVMRIFNQKEKGYRWISVNAIPQFRPGKKRPYQVFTTFDDITERKRAEEQLAYLATHDCLTDLANRRSVEEALKRAVARARRRSASALLFLDVDNFKLVNDTLGHAAGDKVLIALTHRVRKNLRTEDMLARLGGDEFAVLMEGIGIETAWTIAERMRRAVESFPFALGEHSFNLSLSIGLVLVSGNQDPSLLLSKADNAMYTAKEHGGNQIVLYEPNGVLVELAPEPDPL
ncbi:MAG: diguanylate cyclase [Actinobacteria bacterium]|nr:diguanylate cyclase [Actinomycetota bacterium]